MDDRAEISPGSIDRMNVGRIAERDPPRLRSLAEHGDVAPAQVARLQREAAALRHPDPGAVEELEQGDVPERERLAAFVGFG